MFASAFRSVAFVRAPRGGGRSIPRERSSVAGRPRCSRSEEVRHDTVCGEATPNGTSASRARSSLAAALARSIRIDEPASACAASSARRRPPANASASVRTCSVDVRSRTELSGREGDGTAVAERGERNDRLTSRREADGLGAHAAPSHRERRRAGRPRPMRRSAPSGVRNVRLVAINSRCPAHPLRHVAPAPPGDGFAPPAASARSIAPRWALISRLNFASPFPGSRAIASWRSVSAVSRRVSRSCVSDMSQARPRTPRSPAARVLRSPSPRRCLQACLGFVAKQRDLGIGDGGLLQACIRKARTARRGLRRRPARRGSARAALKATKASGCHVSSD